MPSFCCFTYVSAKKKQEIRSYDLFTVFQMSDYSEKSKRIVKKCKLGSDDLEVKYDHEGQNQVIVLYNGEKYTFNLVETKDEDEFGKMVQQTHVSCDYYFDYKQNGIVFLTNKLMEILNKKEIDSIRFDDQDRDIRELCDFPAIFNIRRLNISKPAVSKAELNYISTNFKQIDLFCFHTIAPKGMETYALDYPCVCISDKPELELADLLKMECLHMDLYGITRFTISDMNKFIKYWLNSKQRMFIRTLEIEVLNDDSSDILEGIAAKPWNRKIRSEYFYQWKGVADDLSQGMDILRSDGMLATVILTDTNNFRFYVWEERFQDVPDDCGMFR